MDTALYESLKAGLPEDLQARLLKQSMLVDAQGRLIESLYDAIAAGNKIDAEAAAPFVDQAGSFQDLAS